MWQPRVLAKKEHSANILCAADNFFSCIQTARNGNKISPKSKMYSKKKNQNGKRFSRAGRQRGRTEHLPVQQVSSAARTKCLHLKIVTIFSSLSTKRTESRVILFLIYLL